MLNSKITEEIQQHVEKDIVMVSPLSSATNAETYRLSLEDQSFLVVKVSEKGLDIEAYMMRYLKEKTDLPTPTVIYSQPHVMVMEHISSEWYMDALAEKIAGKHLAKLHRITADRFGFEIDTLIGSLHQPNPQMESWPEFFATYRLLYMAEKAYGEKRIEKDLLHKIEKLSKKIPDLLPNSSKPCLIHGDVWAGNILSARGEIKAFLDPAIYYADPEIELAFTTLFDTFSSNFYRAYHEINPIAEDFFKERRELYNLYPLLVHCRIFGKSYARKVNKIVEKFI